MAGREESGMKVLFWRLRVNFNAWLGLACPLGLFVFWWLGHRVRPVARWDGCKWKLKGATFVFNTGEEQMNPITKAEGEINRILAKLEQETNSVVERVEMEDIEVTGLHSERKELQRRVRIDMARLPGTNWNT
jgi:hypothetical protein